VASIAAVVVAVLVTGTVAAMVVTQEARRDGPVASNIRLKAKPGDRYRVCFYLTRDDSVGVDLVDEGENVVRTLVLSDELQGGEPHCFDWDGADDRGDPVPPGRYRLRLTLLEADRVATSGERLTIDEAP
jgi:hypothetical protein